jgi:hypothetical protein
MLFQYSAANTLISLSGFGVQLTQRFGSASHTITGYGEDTFLEIEVSDDAFVTKVGADGTVVRSGIENPLATATLSLQQTSPSNLVLEYLHQLDKEILGAGVVTFTVEIPSIKSDFIQSGFGTGVPFTGTAYVKKTASYSYGKESGERSWVLDVVNPVIEKSVLNSLIAVGANIGQVARDIRTMVDIG